MRIFSKFHVGLIFLWNSSCSCKHIIGLTDCTSDLENEKNSISSTISPDAEQSNVLEYFGSIYYYFFFPFYVFGALVPLFRLLI